MNRMPKPDQAQFKNLLQDIDRGNIKIPQFQRKFVWSKEQSANLLDSIIKGYPIGTFILWKTRERLRSIRNIGGAQLPDACEGDFIQYVLDGQQRMTSIYASFKGLTVDNEDYSKIYVDLLADESEKIVVPHIDENRPENTYITISDLINYRGSPRDLVIKYGDLYDTVYNYKSKLEMYPFSLIILSDAPIEVATDVFTRLNVGGRPLTVFEIMCARMYDESRNFDLSEKFALLVEKWSRCDYETISAETVLQSISLCLCGECKGKNILNLNKDQFIESWDKIDAAFDDAIDFFRSFFRIPVSNLLPYRAIIVPYVYYFYNCPGRASANRTKYLQDFFWRIILNKRYTEGMEGKISYDCRNIIDVILSDTRPTYDQGVNISESQLKENGYFSVSNAYIKGLLCLLIHQQPKSFSNNSLVILDNSWLSRANSKNYHHFFPKAFLKRNGIEDNESNHIANIVLVDDHLNKGVIKDKAPSKYMRKFKEENPQLNETMKTHLISLSESGIWEDDYPLFVRYRLARFKEQLKEKLIWTKLDKM